MDQKIDDATARPEVDRIGRLAYAMFVWVVEAAMVTIGLVACMGAATVIVHAIGWLAPGLWAPSGEVIAKAGKVPAVTWIGVVFLFCFIVKWVRLVDRAWNKDERQ